jgi:hypothetical protein
MENTETNMVYTPLVNKENTVLCMYFDHTNAYQTTDLEWWLPTRPDYTEELVDYVFKREVKYLALFQDRTWAVNIIDIEFDTKKIFIEWGGESLNHIIYSGRDLDKILPDWQEQMLGILQDITNLGYYKVSLYPHCYTIQHGILKTFDFYATAGKEFPYMYLSDIKGLMGTNSGHRFEEAIVEDKLDLEQFCKRSISTHIKWPNDALSVMYNKIFNTT